VSGWLFKKKSTSDVKRPSVCQEAHRILRKLKVPQCDHKCLPLVRILCRMNPVHARPRAHLFKLRFNIILPPRASVVSCFQLVQSTVYINFSSA
jgi:hypothetical protein